jgi:hypothetical protein
LPRWSVAQNDVVNAHWKLDVLELLLADILKSQVEPIADIVADRLRDGYPSGFGDTFEPGRDIDAVAKNIIVIDDYVAKVDADAEFDTAVFGNPGIADRHIPLNFGGAFDRVYDAGEFDQHSVAGQLDDAPLMLRNGGVNELGPMSLEADERADLVRAHQAAISDYVGGKDRGKSAFHLGNCPHIGDGV